METKDKNKLFDRIIKQQQKEFSPWMNPRIADDIVRAFDRMMLESGFSEEEKKLFSATTRTRS